MKCKYHVDDKTTTRLLENVLACYLDQPYHRLLREYVVVNVVLEDGRIEILLTPRYSANLLSLLPCEHVYTMGLHVASIHRRDLRLHLSLGQLIEHVITRSYIIVREKPLRKLLYGRQVFVSEDEYIEYVPPPREECKRVAVLDENRRFAAWGVIRQASGGKLLIKPLVDVGWYLRSGV
ncbi:PUA domain-containing protein [Pyrolobus fumarii]|nr:hypothetical protein [Pyrolobus fumarii]